MYDMRVQYNELKFIAGSSIQNLLIIYMLLYLLLKQALKYAKTVYFYLLLSRFEFCIFHLLTMN